MKNRFASKNAESKGVLVQRFSLSYWKDQGSSQKSNPFYSLNFSSVFMGDNSSMSGQ